MKDKTSNIKLTKETIPSHATHPGILIADEIKYKGMKQKELAIVVGIAPSVLNEIINGKRNLTAELAFKFEKALDIDAAYWMRLQVRYEIDIIRIKHYNGNEKKRATSKYKMDRTA